MVQSSIKTLGFGVAVLKADKDLKDLAHFGN